jgi:hypothetical protein
MKPKFTVSATFYIRFHSYETLLKEKGGGVNNEKVDDGRGNCLCRNNVGRMGRIYVPLMGK